MNSEVGSEVTTTLVGGCLIVRFPPDLAGSIEPAHRAVVVALQRSLARTAVLELSATRYIDDVEFDGIRTLVNVLSLMGARCLLVGLRPGIVTWLADNNVDLTGLEFDQDLDRALQRLAVVAPRSTGRP